MKGYLNVLIILFGLNLFSIHGQVFEASNKTLSHIHDVLESFNQAIIKNYRNLMPNVTTKVGDELNDLLKEIDQLTGNKRVFDQTRTRYGLFVKNAQDEIDQSIEQIQTELEIVKNSSIRISSRLYEAAQLLEIELREKSCTDAEVLLFFRPYMNETVDCIRKAITIESHYEKNARAVAAAAESILDNVVTALRLCTNKGSRVTLCAQRVSIILIPLLC